MAETTDNTDSVSHNKYVSNQTLFPILGSQGKSAGTSRGLIFPCASSSVETKSAYVDKGRLNWKRERLTMVKVIQIWRSKKTALSQLDKQGKSIS